MVSVKSGYINMSKFDIFGSNAWKYAWYICQHCRNGRETWSKASVEDCARVNPETTDAYRQQMMKYGDISVITNVEVQSE